MKLIMFVEEYAETQSQLPFYKQEMWTYAAKAVAEFSDDVQLSIDAARLHSNTIGYAESEFDRSLYSNLHSAFVADSLRLAQEKGTDEQVEQVWGLVERSMQESSMANLLFERTALLLNNNEPRTLPVAISKLDLVACTEAQRRVEKRSGLYSSTGEFVSSSENLARVQGDSTLILNLSSMLRFSSNASMGVSNTVIGIALNMLSKVPSVPVPLTADTLGEIVNLPAYARAMKKEHGEICPRPTSEALIIRAEHQLEITSRTEKLVTSSRTPTGRRKEVTSMNARKLLQFALSSLLSVEAQWESYSSGRRERSLDRAVFYYYNIKPDLSESENKMLVEALGDARESLKSTKKEDTVSSPSLVETL